MRFGLGFFALFASAVCISISAQLLGRCVGLLAGEASGDLFITAALFVGCETGRPVAMGGWRIRGDVHPWGRLRAAEGASAPAAELIAGVVGEPAAGARGGERGTALRAEAPVFTIVRLAARALHLDPSWTLARSIHEHVLHVLPAPSPCPLPRCGGEGSNRSLSLAEGEGRGEGGVVFTNNPG